MCVPELLQSAKVILKTNGGGGVSCKISDCPFIFENKVETKTAPPKNYLCEETKKAINEAFSDLVKHDEKEPKKLTTWRIWNITSRN